MLAFCMIIFSFVSFAFSKSIFAMRIPNVTIPYRFRVNFALHPSILVQPSSPLNFSAFSSFVVCIAMSPLGRVCAARNLVIVMLFSIRWASILCATSSRTCFVINSTEALSMSLITISLFMLYRRGRKFALTAIAAQVCSLRRATVAACYFFRIVNLSFMQFCC